MAWHRFCSTYGCSNISHNKGCRNLITSKDLISALTFTNRYADINNPCWQTVEWNYNALDVIVQLSQRYREPVGCFLLLLAVILSESIREKRRSKNWVAKKLGTIKSLSEWHHIFCCTISQSVIFCQFSWELLSRFLGDVF